MRVTTTHSQPTKQIRNELTEFCAKKETIQINQCHAIDSGHCQLELSTEFVGNFSTCQAHVTAFGKTLKIINLHAKIHINTGEQHENLKTVTQPASGSAEINPQGFLSTAQTSQTAV
jgi:hypothetical protein